MPGPRIKVSLFAPDGRIGQAIVAAATETPGFEIVEGDGDILIDFSVPGALGDSLARAVAADPAATDAIGVIDAGLTIGRQVGRAGDAD